MARNSTAWSSKRKIPKAEPATIWTLALISRVSGKNTVALRANTPGMLNRQKGVQQHGGVPVLPMLAAGRRAGGWTWGGYDHFNGQTCQPAFVFLAKSLIASSRVISLRHHHLAEGCA